MPVRNATTPVTVSLRREPRDQRDQQVDALRLLEQRDQHRHAADHHDDPPRHPLDRLAIVGRAGEHEHDRREKRAHADVDVEEDDAEDERGDDARA